MPLHHEPLPPAPGFGRDTIADVFSSAAAALDVPGFENVLGLPGASRICVVMVDGLGKALLKQRGGHAPFLRKCLENSRTLRSAFPSTTASSLASLGTGLEPGLHGMVGYDVLDPAQDKVVNQLGGWDAEVDPRKWQPHATVFERAAEHVSVTTVSLPKFANSGMTQAALRGGTFIPATSGHARTQATVEALSGQDRALVYLYFNELDKAGHRYGSSSAEWGNALEEMDSDMRRLAGQLPPDTLLLLTADHGMLDVSREHRYDYSLQPELVEGVRHTGGEPRLVHLYLEPDAGARQRDKLTKAWRESFGKHAWILDRDEAVAHGLFGRVDASVLPRIGDLMIAAREPIALYDTRRVAERAMDVVGQHGSLTRAEREVPLLTLGSTVRSLGKKNTAKGK